MENITTLPRFIGAEEYKDYFFQCQPTEKKGRYELKCETPNGGALLVFLFVDKSNERCDIGEAAFVEIQELDQNNSLIHVEHGKVDKYEKWNN
jgi:hypothetical protein